MEVEGEGASLILVGVKVRFTFVITMISDKKCLFDECTKRVEKW